MQYIVRVTITLGCIESVQGYPNHYLLAWKSPATHIQNLTAEILSLKSTVNSPNESIATLQTPARSATVSNQLLTSNNVAQDVSSQTSATNSAPKSNIPKNNISSDHKYSIKGCPGGTSRSKRSKHNVNEAL